MVDTVNRYCFALDLIDTPELIDAYKEYHRTGNVNSGVLKSIRDAGVLDMEIYLTGNRLFMIMEVDAQFSFAEKAGLDANNLVVQEWEALMLKYQKPLDWAKEHEKWTRMERIFRLRDHLSTQTVDK